jgi:hypothetical protein
LEAAAKVSSRTFALAEDPDIVSMNVPSPIVNGTQDTTTTYSRSGGAGGIVVVRGQETARLIALFKWQPVILNMVHCPSQPCKVPSKAFSDIRFDINVHQDD